MRRSHTVRPRGCNAAIIPRCIGVFNKYVRSDDEIVRNRSATRYQDDGFMFVFFIAPKEQNNHVWVVRQRPPHTGLTSPQKLLQLLFGCRGDNELMVLGRKTVLSGKTCVPCEGRVRLAPNETRSRSRRKVRAQAARGSAGASGSSCRGGGGVVGA